MLNWISSACIVLAGQAGPLYVNTKISMSRGKVKALCIPWDGLCRPIIVLSSYLGIATELVRKESYERRRKEDCERQDGVHHSDVLHGNADVLKTVSTENYVN